jgi:hypothetical protein
MRHLAACAGRGVLLQLLQLRLLLLPAGTQLGSTAMLESMV